MFRGRASRNSLVVGAVGATAMIAVGLAIEGTNAGMLAAGAAVWLVVNLILAIASSE